MYDSKYDLDKNVQRLRDEITPLFSKLTLKTFQILELKHNQNHDI